MTSPHVPLITEWILSYKTSGWPCQAQSLHLTPYQDTQWTQGSVAQGPGDNWFCRVAYAQGDPEDGTADNPAGAGCRPIRPGSGGMSYHFPASLQDPSHLPPSLHGIRESVSNSGTYPRVFLIFEIRFYCVVQAGFKLEAILLQFL